MAVFGTHILTNCTFNYDHEDVLGAAYEAIYERIQLNDRYFRADHRDLGADHSEENAMSRLALD